MRSVKRLFGVALITLVTYILGNGDSFTCSGNR
jgi:hypothetical protein